LEKVIILGIESTSHTFGVGIVSYVNGKIEILANIYDRYIPVTGGIHPREASIHHAKVSPEIVRKALNKARISINDIDGIAVALGPGLGPCLRVGATLGRFLSAYYEKSN